MLSHIEEARESSTGGRVAMQDPNNLKDYLAKNRFLADLNNEHETKSTLLRDNLASLERFVLFRFADDFTVVPKDSAWFGGYFGKQWQDLRETDLYKVKFLHAAIIVL